ncbi:MAG: ATP-binding protein [Lachnospiraceae bacterium]|nr:ATP-binding protein [Lachnospiraceae bacterium]
MENTSGTSEYKGGQQGKAHIPYQDDKEYMKDCFHLLRLLLEGEVDQEGYSCLKSREEVSRKRGFIPIFTILCERFQVTEFERFCILLSLSTQEDIIFGRYFQRRSRDMKSYAPTVHIAISMYEKLRQGNREALLSELENSERLSRKALFWLEDGKQDAPLMRHIRTGGALYRAVYGLPVMAQTGMDVWSYQEALQEGTAEMLVNGKHLEKLTSFARLYGESDMEQECLMNLYGEWGIGRKYMLRLLCGKMGMGGILILNMEVLQELSSGEQREWLSSLRIESVLKNCLLVVEHFDMDRKRDFYDLLRELTTDIRLAAVLTDAPLSQTDLSEKMLFPIKFQEYPGAESVEVWKHYLSPYCAPEVRLEIYGNNYHYTAGHVKQLSELARAEAMMDGKTLVEDMHLKKALRTQKMNQNISYATLQNCTFTMEDLMLADKEKRVLSNLCNQVRYRYVVNEEWGMDGKLPYGKGVSILIYGPPGTGKSMSAQVIANELKLDMYRVDLAQIVSKYIGETEKYLAEVFELARKNSGILFFDEADSIFAARTSVSDSKDKYANNETAYLLQKMEEYDGITILATNYLGNIDHAFRRRFQYILGINAPDAAVRLKIWNSVFPPNAPVANDIHLEYLAEQYEFTGSSIKSVARAACYLAAAEKSPVMKKHLVEAIKDELVKNGSPMDAVNVRL